MKSLFTAIASTLGGTFLLTSTAHAVLILTPMTPGVVSPAAATNPMNAGQVASIVGYDGDLTEVYKQNAGGKEELSFKNSYTTAFNADFSNATITFDGAQKPFITGSPIYAVAKDGNNAPYSYIWDISNWNGVEQIQMQNLWPSNGAISHVSIFTGNRTTTSNHVPDGGATAALLGLALGGLSVGRRLLAK